MNTRARHLVSLALLGLLSACSATEPGAPVPERVAPGEGSTRARTAVVIHGRSFVPLVRANFDDESRASVSTAFAASLGVYALEQVAYLDGGRLSATVPAGLPPGSYRLTVMDPRGRQGALEAAFVVRAEVLEAGSDAPRTDGGADASPADGPISPDAPRDTGGGLEAAPPDTQPGPMVATLAGTGAAGFKDGPLATALFNLPRGVAVAGTTVLVGDYGNHRVRAIAAGNASTLAGSGTQGLLNGAAATAQFNFPVGLAVDGSGAVFVADSSNDVIRKILSGTVTTAAGSGVKGFLDGAAATARFNYPHGVAAAGNTIYVADTANHRIRLIQGGTVSTFAGSGTNGWLDGPASSARFSSPSGLAWSGSVLYVADAGNNRIRAISGGVVSTVAGSGTQGNADGAALAATFWNPTAVATAPGKIYVADQSNHRIRVVEKGTVYTLSGSGPGFKDGPAASALFQYPSGLAVGLAGQLYVADQSNQRIRVITF